jgi:hypothetical protein
MVPLQYLKDHANKHKHEDDDERILPTLETFYASTDQENDPHKKISYVINGVPMRNAKTSLFLFDTRNFVRISLLKVLNADIFVWSIR